MNRRDWIQSVAATVAATLIDWSGVPLPTSPRKKLTLLEYVKQLPPGPLDDFVKCLSTPVAGLDDLSWWPIDPDTNVYYLPLPPSRAWFKLAEKDDDCV